MESGLRLTAPHLESGEVLVRPYRGEDAAGIVERSEDELTGQWTTMPRGLSVEEALGWIESVGMGPADHLLPLAIEVQGRYAGHIGLRSEGDGGHVHFDTCPWARGRGVAGVATRLLTEWALRDLAWSAVIWRAHVGNVGSAKTAWRAGFPRPMVVPYSLVLDGRLVDGWYSVLTDPSKTPLPGRWEDYLFTA